jgi:hypothetical protein
VEHVLNNNKVIDTRAADAQPKAWLGLCCRVSVGPVDMPGILQSFDIG